MDSFAQTPTISAAALDEVRGTAGVDLAVGDISDTAQIMDRDGEPLGDGPYFGSGFDARTPGSEKLTPYRLGEGRWATAPGEVVIDQGSAEKADYAVGDRIRVATRGEAREFDVVGIATFADVKSIGTATFAVFDLAAAQDLFGKADAYDRLLVAGDLDQGPAGTVVRSAAADDRFDLEGLKSFVDILRTILLAFAGVALLVGAFTIFNALSIAIAQRTRELGLLRMVGASRRQVRRMVLLEALAIGLGASAIGLGVGLLLASGLESLFGSMGLSLPIAGMSLTGGTVIAAMLIGVGVTLVAALLPARRATKVAPVAALREAGDAVSRVRLPGRVLRWVTGLVGRPSARFGGSAGAARAHQRDAPSRPHGVDGVGAADRRRAGDRGDRGGQGSPGRLGGLARAPRAGDRGRRVGRRLDADRPRDRARGGLRPRRDRGQLAGPGRRARLRRRGGRQRRRSRHGE